MKNTPLFRLCTIAVLLTCLTANAADFRLKGLSLGSSAAIACGSSKVTDNFGEIIRRYRADAPALTDMGTTECQVEYDSFGGNKLAGPAELLFLNDSLILMKLELSGLSASSFSNIYDALLEDYGKPTRSVSKPFVTDTWKRRGETLILERTGREWDDNDVILILRQESSYRIFEARSKANKIELEKLDRRKTKNDIR